jgi:hypothetical protein
MCKQDNENSVHIAWTAILLHTREVLLPLYQWQTSFDPLTRKYEQAKGKTLNRSEFRKLKCLIAKQITDVEKIILAGIDSSFTIENVDKGEYVLRNFQDKKLASNASRFLTYLLTSKSQGIQCFCTTLHEEEISPFVLAFRLRRQGRNLDPIIDHKQIWFLCWHKPHSGASSQFICNFCHLHGHTERNCRKKNALHHSNSYQHARSQFNNRQQLVMDQLMSVLGAYNLIAPQLLVTLLKTLNFILKLPTCFSPHYYLMFKMLNLAWLSTMQPHSCRNILLLMVLIGGKPTPKFKLLTQMTMIIRIQPLSPPGMNC